MNLNLDLNNSWLSEVQATSSTTLGSSGDSIFVQLEIDGCGTESGQGELFKLRIKNLTEPVVVDTLLEGADGIIIKIDNISG